MDVPSAVRQIIGKMNVHRIPTLGEAKDGKPRAPGEPKVPRARADIRVAPRGVATIVEGRTGR